MMKKIISWMLVTLMITACGTSPDLDQAVTETTSAIEVQTTEVLMEDESVFETSAQTEQESADDTMTASETMTEPETRTEPKTTIAENEVGTTRAEEETMAFYQAKNWSALNAERFQVDEVRALWLTYLDLQPVFENGSALAFKAAMLEVVNNAKSLGLNTIMFQVRPFGDALYPSTLFPTSYIISGEEGLPLPYDPLQIMIEIAHGQGMRVEAWINPYRVRTSTSTVALSDNNIAKVWLEDGSRRVLEAADGTIVYNPSNAEAKQRIIDGVKEIIYEYAVDGIHFDDYFYPTTEMAFDEVEYLGFLHDSDELSQGDWRRYNVNELIASVYEAIQVSEGNLVFGISPQGTIDTNYEQLYADVALWLSEPGYVDYVVPQLYFGFNNDYAPFGDTLAEWHQLNRLGVDIIPGIAVYKVGKEDLWAGEGSLEWVETIGIIRDMIIEAKSYDNYKGFALYRYDFLYKPEAELQERIELEIDDIKKELEQ